MVPISVYSHPSEFVGIRKHQWVSLGVCGNLIFVKVARSNSSAAFWCFLHSLQDRVSHAAFTRDPTLTLHGEEKPFLHIITVAYGKLIV